MLEHLFILIVCGVGLLLLYGVGWLVVEAIFAPLVDQNEKPIPEPRTRIRSFRLRGPKPYTRSRHNLF